MADQQNAEVAPPRPRGRPRKSEADIAQRRKEIVEAAFEVFADRGYHASGIADIAERLDLGHGTFYRYFDNKRDILDHVIDFGVARLMAGLPVDDLLAASSNAELRAAMTRFGDQLFTEGVDKDPRLPRLLLLETPSIDEELLQRVLGLIETAVHLLEPIIASGVDHGFLRRTIDPESVARAVFGCTMAALFAEARSPMTASARRRYVDTVVSMVCDNVEPGSAGYA